MFKQTKVVPKGIRYFSEWKGFKLEDYPYILDKKIPGCGFTEWCLTNNQPLVLCSPRRVLLQNKLEQHPGEVFYLKNNFEKVLEIEKDLTKVDKRGCGSNKVDDDVETVDEQEAKKKFYQESVKNLMGYINYRQSNGLPPKILVTYDSFHIVKGILKNASLLYDFQIVIDEFQSVLIDVKFKSNTELTFMSQLQGLQKVCFVSATPFMEKYLNKTDEFKFLPYVELDWGSDEPGRVVKPRLAVKILRSVSEVSKEVIDEYKSGNFVGKYVLDENKNPKYVESKEAVIYVNSVNNIINIVKANDLKPNEVNLLIADTEENRKKIKRKLGKYFTIGKVPLKKDPRKMFTLCTRTVYLGADFYSDNARTFIFSDANIETLAVDISLDLPQILGRQRLIENPWKNEASFYYKPLFKNKKVSQAEFDKRQAKKKKLTNDILISYSKTPKENLEGLVDLCEFIAKVENYRSNYVSVDKKFNPVTMKYEKVPVFNNLVFVAEERAFEMQQIDYADRFTVFNSVNSAAGEVDGRVHIDNFFAIYDKLPDITKKLKYLCESDLEEDFIKLYILPLISEPHFDEYFVVLGPERCKALGYNTTRLKNELSIMSFSEDILVKEIYKEFKEGQRISNVDAKKKLQDIYNLVGYSRKAKATDLNEYFETKAVKILKPTTIHGLELLKKK